MSDLWFNYSATARLSTLSESIPLHYHDAVGVWAYSALNDERIVEDPAPTQCWSCPITAMVGAVAMTRMSYPRREGRVSNEGLQTAHKLMLEIYKGPWAKEGEGISFQSYVQSEPPFTPADVVKSKSETVGLCRKPEEFAEFFIAFHAFHSTPGYMHGRGKGYHPVGAPKKWRVHDYMMGRKPSKPVICELCMYADSIRDLLTKICVPYYCRGCLKTITTDKRVSTYYKVFEDDGIFI